MKNIFSNSINLIYENLSAKAIFLLSIIIISIFFIIALIKSLHVRGYGIKKRIWFIIFSLGVLACQLGVIKLKEFNVGGFYLALGLSVILYIPILCIRERKVNVTKEQSEFIKNLTKHSSAINNITSIKSRPKTESILRCEKETMLPTPDFNNQFQLSFQHVKKVIEKLNYYGLSSADKKTVLELSDAIEQAEQGGFNQNLKIKINDGLGALLKIMSKHGV